MRILYSNDIKNEKKKEEKVRRVFVRGNLISRISRLSFLSLESISNLHLV